MQADCIKPPLLLCFVVFMVMLPFQNSNSQSFYQERIPRNDSFAFGLGPSFIYADNGGQYRIYNFEWNPSFSLMYEKRVSDHISFRASTGMQWIESGGNPTEGLVERWLKKEQAVSFKGQAFHIEVIPMFNLAPNFHHMTRSDFNIYIGLGFGALLATTQQNFSLESTGESKQVLAFTSTLPFRTGISYSLNKYYDLALEGSLIFTFSDKIDGNTVTQTRNDHLAQAQLVIRKYLSPR